VGNSGPLTNEEIVRLASAGTLAVDDVIRNEDFRKVAEQHLDLNSAAAHEEIRRLFAKVLAFQGTQPQPRRSGNMRLSRMEEAIIVGRMLLDRSDYRNIDERVETAIGAMDGVYASRVNNNRAAYWASFIRELAGYLATHPREVNAADAVVTASTIGGAIGDFESTQGWFVPHQLPARRRVFVNRSSEIRELVGINDRASKSGRPTVVILHGGHGVGKSAMSEHWAHENRRNYSDGQIYLDFAEIRRDGAVAMGDAVAGVLRSFGLTEEQIPRAFHEKVQRYRSLTANRRVLLVLDDVEHAAQVTPFIPDSAGATILVTTRMALDELLAAGAERLRLDALVPDKATHLLAELIGEERITAEPDAAAELLCYCGGLPLAIDICGARLHDDPETSLAMFVGGLRDEAKRLANISLGTKYSVQTVFDGAYRTLSNREASLYRKLGLHPAPSFSVRSAAAAADVDINTAAASLTALQSSYLLEMTTVDGEERYRFHDLLRVHARQLGLKLEDADEQVAELRRIARYYAALSIAIDKAMTKERLRFAPVMEPTIAAPDIRSVAEAFNTFERERASFVSVQRAAFEAGSFQDAWVIGEALWPPYHGRLHPDESKGVFDLGARAAAEDGHLEAEARLLMLRARAEMELGAFDDAELTLSRSRALSERSSDVRLRGSANEATGILYLDQGSFGTALTYFAESRAQFVSVQSPRGTAIQDYVIGRAHQGAGSFELAAAAYRLSAQVLEDLDDRLLLGRVLLHWGETLLELTDPEAAIVLERSAEIARQLGAEKNEASACEALATIAERAGRADDTAGFLRRAAGLYERLSDDRATLVSARLAALVI
jgi:tetratricopeptide (TPR) repeat protein